MASLIGLQCIGGESPYYKKDEFGLNLEDYLFEKNTEETRENIKKTIENYLKTTSSLAYEVEITQSLDDPTILNCNIIPYKTAIEINITVTKDDVVFSSSDSWCDICDRPIEYCRCEK